MHPGRVRGAARLGGRIPVVRTSPGGRVPCPSKSQILEALNGRMSGVASSAKVAAY